MISIDNILVREYFEKFSKATTETEKRDLMSGFSNIFENMKDDEKEEIRASWLRNMGNIKKEVQGVRSEIATHLPAINVYPASKNELKLLENLFKKMGIKYNVAA